MLELRQLQQLLSSTRDQGQDYFIWRYSNFIAYIQAHESWFQEQLSRQDSCQLITQIMATFLEKIPQEVLLKHEAAGYIPNLLGRNHEVLKILAINFPQIMAYLPDREAKTDKLVKYICKKQVKKNSLLQEVNLFGDISSIAELAFSKLSTVDEIISLGTHIVHSAKEGGQLLDCQTVGDSQYNICFLVTKILGRVRGINLGSQNKYKALVQEIINYVNNKDSQLLIQTQNYKNKASCILEEVFTILKNQKISGGKIVIDNLFKIIQRNSTLKSFILDHEAERISRLASFVLDNKNLEEGLTSIMTLLQENPERIFEDMQHGEKVLNYANLLCRSFSLNWFSITTKREAALSLLLAALNSPYGIKALYRNDYANFAPLPAIFVVDSLPLDRTPANTIRYFIDHEDKHVFCRRYANYKSMVEVLTSRYASYKDLGVLRIDAIQNLITVLQEFQHKEREVTANPSPYLLVAKEVLNSAPEDKNLVRSFIESTGRNINFISLIYWDIFRLFSTPEDASYSKSILQQIVAENPKVINSYAALNIYKEQRDCLKQKKKLSDQAKEQLVPIVNLLLEAFKDRPREILKNANVETKSVILGTERDEYYSGVMQYMIEGLCPKEFASSFKNFLILRNQDVPQHVNSTFKKIFENQEVIKQLLANQDYAYFLQNIIYIAAAHYIDEIKEIDLLQERGNRFLIALKNAIREVQADYSIDVSKFFVDLTAGIEELALKKGYTGNTIEVSEVARLAYQQREQIRLDISAASPLRRDSVISKNIIALSELSQNLTGEKQRLFAIAVLAQANLAKLTELSSLKSQTNEALVAEVFRVSNSLGELKFSSEELHNFEHDMEKLEELYLLINEYSIFDADISLIIEQIPALDVESIMEHLYLCNSGALDGCGDIELANMQARPRQMLVKRETNLTITETAFEYFSRQGDVECEQFLAKIQKYQTLEEREKDITSYKKRESNTAEGISL